MEKNTETRQYLLFIVGDILYGIEALKAQEIVEYTQITKVPMVSSFVKGVANIRGNIIPIIDLQERFSIGESKVTEKTSIIVINYAKENVNTRIGIIVDEIYEVDSIALTEIKKSPEFGTKIDSRFILYMGKYEDEYIEILNIETILDIDELSKLVM